MTVIDRFRRLAPALLVAALAGCPDGGADDPRPTPAPDFGGPIDEAPRDSVLAYAARLAFDTTLEGGDEQRLPLAGAGGVGFGPNVRVEPEVGAVALTRAALGAGRIVARMRADGPYPPLGLSAGMNYVWVDTIGGGLRRVVIPESARDPVQVGGALLEEHPPEYFGTRAARGARFVDQGSAAGAQYPCTKYGCCRDSGRTGDTR